MKWGRWCRLPTRRKVLGYIDLGVEEGATLVADGRNYQVPGYPEGYYVGGAVRPCEAEYAHLPQKRSSGQCWASCGCRTIAPPSARSTAMSLATAAPSLPAAATTRVSSCRKCRPGWSASTCGAGADGVPQLRRLEALGVRRVERTAPTACASTRMKTATARWPAGQQTVSEFSMPTLGSALSYSGQADLLASGQRPLPGH